MPSKVIPVHIDFRSLPPKFPLGFHEFFEKVFRLNTGPLLKT
jgi:hypothetical protein